MFYVLKFYIFFLTSRKISDVMLGIFSIFFCGCENVVLLTHNLSTRLGVAKMYGYEIQKSNKLR